MKLGRILEELHNVQENKEQITLLTNIPVDGDPSNFYDFTMKQGKLLSGIDGSYTIKTFSSDPFSKTIELQTETCNELINFIVEENSIVMIKKRKDKEK